jgi:hypothetical protein
MLAKIPFFKHKIELSGPPVPEKRRFWVAAKQIEAAACLEEMLSANIIEKASHQWLPTYTSFGNLMEKPALFLTADVLTTIRSSNDAA